MKQALILSLFLIAVSFLFSCSNDKGYRSDIEKWRADHEADLKTGDGWLSVAGLFWLKDGQNTVGRGDQYDVSLTERFRQDRFGQIDLKDGKIYLTVDDRIEGTADGNPISSTIELLSDDPGPATKVSSGSQTFYVIKREDRLGVRLKDSHSPARLNFSGEKWYPVDSNYKLTGTFEPFATPQEIEIPNILGGNFKMKSPGIVKFHLNGKEFALQPVIENDKQLFFIFKDETAGGETYGAGRFLYTDNPLNGQVVLDFNKAENPPCAFTDFATCPLPPEQNRLAVAITAGEKKYGH